MFLPNVPGATSIPESRVSDKLVIPKRIRKRKENKKVNIDNQ